MKLSLHDFFKKGGPGGHGYNKGDMAALMGVTRQTLHVMINESRPVFIYLKGNKVVRIKEEPSDKIWYEAK